MENGAKAHGQGIILNVEARFGDFAVACVRQVAAAHCCAAAWHSYSLPYVTYGESIAVHTEIEERRAKVFIQRHRIMHSDTSPAEGGERAQCTFEKM